MNTRIVVALAIAAILNWRAVGTASAHASLVRANIKNGQTFKVGHAPRTLQAFFAENVDPKQSWINVFEGVADHGLVNEKSRSKVNYRNPKEMTLQLPRLAPEKYYFLWYTDSTDDGHYAAGIVYFQVVK